MDKLVFAVFVVIGVIFLAVMGALFSTGLHLTPPQPTTENESSYGIDTYPNYADKTVCYVLLVGPERKPQSISCLPLTDFDSADIKWPGWRESTQTPENPLLPAQGWPECP